MTLLLWSFVVVQRREASLYTRLGIAEHALNEPRNLTSTTLQTTTKNKDKIRHKNLKHELLQIEPIHKVEKNPSNQQLYAHQVHAATTDTHHFRSQ
jgi:arylamine N-acetyltransferase